MKKSQMMLSAIIGSICSISYANCYVIRNDNNSNIQLQFHYNGTIPNGATTAATVFPHQQFPLGGGQWCWSGTGGAGASIIFSGGGKLHSPSGKVLMGPPMFGDGPQFAPSGLYVVGP
ncbi:hypothetical protein [Burkholderia lata]|uniref:hypothetical protein n=1 Tax=Burkholderia lata (strain ATCC 17760 / DSM 23089 / LMG 22485 / NCIMB 9086 / R18194 / 383) TaxID=482957 RepID=UPI00158296AE|nr:hypothetical protein [Burkholderia lata]